MLIKSKIPTPQQMVQTNREVKRKRAKIEKNEEIHNLHVGASSLSISLYNIYFNNEDTTCTSSHTPFLRMEITLPPKKG